ncbi:MAG: hypothetical protein Ta2C_10310 [Candidatus Endomicrobiellum trichonymphae]|uniref:hypothetical protein n=1 Tax=Endomicrobium trichonymphae TaxID=1408204 RepID=UPI0027D427E4|nr:MAG: hypothetical protein Ta2C_10310 [Candidatus Endomicrobium trichonymphae]
MLIGMSICGQKKELSTVDRLNEKIISFLDTDFYNLNQFKAGKSVLTLGEQEIYLKNSLKASEIYKNINEKKDTLEASDREHQLFLEVVETLEAQKEKEIKK